MPDIIFARPRTPYDSYQDFYRLIELSGFPLIYTDEIDADSDHTYIYSPANGDTRGGWPDVKARIIHYQLEWETHPNDQAPPDPGVAEKWTMDAWHARRIGARYVPIGSHPGLVYEAPNGTTDACYDLALMAYLSGRRQWLVGELERKHLRLAPNGWGAERHHILKRTKAMLHVHQHDAIPGVAALRLAVAAAYRLPVITETCEDYGIFGVSCLLASDYAYLADFAATQVKDERRLADYAHALHQLLCVEHTFRHCIEAAV